MPNRKTGKKKSTLPSLIGFLLIFIGVFLALNIIEIEFTKYKNSSSSNSLSNLKGEPIKIGQFLSDEEQFDPPVRILLPKQQIDLKVVEAPIINGYWETS